MIPLKVAPSITLTPDGHFLTKEPYCKSYWVNFGTGEVIVDKKINKFFFMERCESGLISTLGKRV